MSVTALSAAKLDAQNTFTGNIVVNNTATSPTILQLGANNATPGTATVQLNAGSGLPSRFDLNGFSTTIANLNIASGTVVGNSRTLPFGNTWYVSGNSNPKDVKK